MTKRVAILGASGYTGRELASLVTHHPELELAGLMTARKRVVPEDPALPIDPVITPLDFGVLSDVDGVFLCTPHGAAADLVVEVLEFDCKLVDLSADFRIKDKALYAETYGLEHRAPDLLPEATYGLTELCREELPTTRLVANPGCYPTSILLPLHPLLAAELVDLETTIIADSKSGVSGAGKTPKDRTIFGSVAENFLAYGVGSHRHAPEIHQELWTNRLIFTPHLLPMFRGMLSTIYVAPRAGHTAVDLRGCLMEQYSEEPFVQVFDRGQPETNRVAGTNQCHIAVADAGDHVVITSAIDNLGKGAAGQALQNMNAMLGLEETLGLR